MSQRYLPLNQIDRILKEGTSISDGEGKYSVKLGRWTIKLTHLSCTLFLGTAFLD